MWQNSGVFNGSQGVSGNFTTPANVSSFQVGTEVVLDKGHLTFDDLTLTAYSDAISVAPLGLYQFTAQVTGEVTAGLGQGGRMVAVYENAAGQTVGQAVLWPNPEDFSGTANVQHDFNPGPTTVRIRIALETDVDAGYLTFSNLGLATLPTMGPIIQRSTYSVAGQSIAVKVAGDSVSENNGLFFTYSDHLGSTSMMSYGYNLDGSLHLAAGDPVPGSEARYLPFGGWRTEPTADLTDRGYTGHKMNNLGSNDIGLIYMNARYYSPYINRFVSADSIVPDPANPQQFNRYSYTLNNPIRFIDPTGHSCANPSYVSPGGNNPPEAITCKQQEKDIMDSTVRIVIEGDVFDPSLHYWVDVGAIGHATLMEGGNLLTHNHFEAFSIPNGYPKIQISLYAAGEPASDESRILHPTSLKIFDMLLFDEAPETRVIGVGLPEEIFSYSGIFPAEFSGGTANLYPGQEVAQIRWNGTNAVVDWTTVNQVGDMFGVPAIKLNNDIPRGSSGGGVFLNGVHIGNNWFRNDVPSSPFSVAALNPLEVAKD